MKWQGNLRVYRYTSIVCHMTVMPITIYTGVVTVTVALHCTLQHYFKVNTIKKIRLIHFYKTISNYCPANSMRKQTA